MPRTKKTSRSGPNIRSTAGEQPAQNSLEPVTDIASDLIEVEALTTSLNNNIGDEIPKTLAATEEKKSDPVLNNIAEPVTDGLGKVIAEYDIYFNSPGKRLMLLQYPNRDPGQPYSDKTCSKPLALRVKPKCGLVEVDVPIATHSFFDKKKGITYGEAIRKSRVLQEGGSYGLSGGLKAGMGGGMRIRPPNLDQPSSVEERSQEALLDDFEDANNKGHVMNKLTLGGQIVPWKDGDPIYMVGVFRGNNVFLSKLDAMVQLRPQFTHLDALGDQDKPFFGPRSRGGPENAAVESEARAVNLTVKSSEGEDLDMYGDMSETAKLLKAMREESWQHLAWVDSEDEYSYRVFNDEMFIQDLAGTSPLVSTMTDEQWLDAISCPRIDPTNQGKKVFKMPISDSESSVSDSSDNDNSNENLSNIGEEEGMEEDGAARGKE